MPVEMTLDASSFTNIAKKEKTWKLKCLKNSLILLSKIKTHKFTIF